MHLLPELAACHDVSIPELLASRDERQARQRAWLTRHATPLISFTVVAPGPMKDSALTRRIFNHGVTALHTLAEEYGWTIREQAALASASGPEGLLAIDAPAQALKQATITLEQRYPLGAPVGYRCPDGGRRNTLPPPFRASRPPLSAVRAKRG